MTIEMKTKLQELLKDEEFSRRVILATSLTEEVNLLKEYGIEISEAELQSYGEQAMDILKEDGFISEDGELSDEILEQVSGGKGWRLAALGAGMMGTALLSDYLAGACAFALVSNPIGWFFGGAAVLMASAVVIGKSRKKRR